MSNEKVIEVLKQDILKLNKRIDTIEKGGSWEWWMPKDGESYFAPENTGKIEEYEWNGIHLDHQMHDTHSVFKTKEDAELFAPLNKWQRAIAWVLRELNGEADWIDWSNGEQPKHYFYYSHRQRRVCRGVYGYVQENPTLLHGKSERVMDECHEILGDDVVEKSCGRFV